MLDALLRSSKEDIGIVLIHNLLKVVSWYIRNSEDAKNYLYQKLVSALLCKSNLWKLNLKNKKHIPKTLSISISDFNPLK